ncbi:MAG: adenylosuccinate synthase [Bacteroidales bacterium]
MKESSKADVLLGLQWGDEGKGKVVDVLTPQYNMVARFQGGPNAGHTLLFENRKYILHTIPSGIFHTGCVNVIGNGVVLDPFIFSKEVDQLGLEKKALKKNLFISGKAHLILPGHRLLDAAYEYQKGGSKIGSTLKGIGPAYTDKVARIGLRVMDASADDFLSRYDALKESHFRLAENVGYSLDDLRLDGMRFADYENAWFAGLTMLKSLPQIQSEVFVNQALDQGNRVLAEGAQGTLLDIDFGSYPYVTSSNTITAGACSGLGLAPSRIGEVFGIFKAYCTRVGSGPFPTELLNEEGALLRDQGQEFGSTTGRPRRCGWLDIPALRYAVLINGVTRLIMTKADVLNEFEQIKVCTAYEINGHRHELMPAAIDSGKIKPVYETMKGWTCSLDSARTFEELPAAMLDYIRTIENHTGVPVDVVSTGPDRKQTLIRKGSGMEKRLINHSDN